MCNNSDRPHLDSDGLPTTVWAARLWFSLGVTRSRLRSFAAFLQGEAVRFLSCWRRGLDLLVMDPFCRVCSDRIGHTSDWFHATVRNEGEGGYHLRNRGCSVQRNKNEQKHFITQLACIISDPNRAG